MIKIVPRLPTGKYIEISKSGLSALSNITSQVCCTLDSHLKTVSLSSASPQTVAMFKKPRSIFSTLLASIQKMPQNLETSQRALQMLRLRTFHDILLRISSTTGSFPILPGRTRQLLFVVVEHRDSPKAGKLPEAVYKFGLAG